MIVGDSLVIHRPDDSMSGVKVIHTFPSGDFPGLLYINVYQERITKEEATKLRDYINDFLGDAIIEKNLNKDVIKALGDRDGK